MRTFTRPADIRQYQLVRRRSQSIVGPALFALLSVQCGAVEVDATGCPELTGPTAVMAGEAATVVGQGFSKGECGPPSPGCAASVPGQPATNVTLTLRQGDSSWVLGKADAGQDSELVVEVDVPREVQRGEATVVAVSPDLAEPEELTVRVEGAGR